jgi:heme exporter protein A
MADAVAVEMNGIAKKFARRWVLRGADLQVKRGEAVALMGKNGSGKTTMLRVVATLLRPTRGIGRVFGYDIIKEAADIRERIGVLGHHAGLYDDLTASENLRFSLRMAGLAHNAPAVDKVLDEVGLTAERNERVRGFSAGMRRRLALGRLLLRRPELLLLDEPYAAFDPAGIDLINTFARKITEDGGTVIVVTHDYARAREAVSRVVRIENGLVLEGLSGASISPDDHALAVGEEQ